MIYEVCNDDDAPDEVHQSRGRPKLMQLLSVVADIARGFAHKTNLFNLDGDLNR